MKQMENDYELGGIFPVPIYQTYRNSDLGPIEEAEIKDIIKEGMKGTGPEELLESRENNSVSSNSYVFNTKLQELKGFCEKHIKSYVKETIDPREELEFYITQSWLSITRPGEVLRQHNHTNSIISGVFYISTEEDDRIIFFDPNVRLKEFIKCEHAEHNLWNSSLWFYPSKNNGLILWPSWLDHAIRQNLNATTDRISLAFNVFVKGKIGVQGTMNELVLR